MCRTRDLSETLRDPWNQILLAGDRTSHRGNPTPVGSAVLYEIANSLSSTVHRIPSSEIFGMSTRGPPDAAPFVIEPHSDSTIAWDQPNPGPRRVSKKPPSTSTDSQPSERKSCGPTSPAASHIRNPNLLRAPN